MDAARAAMLRGPIFWLKAARAPFFTGSLAPVLVGTAVGFYESEGVRWGLDALALVALTLLHATANLANDYYDHLSGNDEANVSFAHPFTGGSRVIQQGAVDPLEMLVAALVSLYLGCGIGVYLVWVTGWPLLVLGLIGAASGFFYSAPPVKLGYRGLGEISILLNFGVLPVLGAFYVQTESFSAGAAVAGATVGLLMTNVLWINQFQDAEADAAVGKRNWVVRLGRRRAALVHAGLFGLAYAAVAGGILWHVLPVGAALGFLGTGPALGAIRVSALRYDDLPKLTPANVGTVAAHLLTSVLLAVGIAASGLV
jgi:1,4-dihydroxy-2-naphthoate octaprenyltransferase